MVLPPCLMILLPHSSFHSVSITRPWKPSSGENFHSSEFKQKFLYLLTTATWARCQPGTEGRPRVYGEILKGCTEHSVAVTVYNGFNQSSWRLWATYLHKMPMCMLIRGQCSLPNQFRVKQLCDQDVSTTWQVTIWKQVNRVRNVPRLENVFMTNTLKTPHQKVGAREMTQW